MNKLRYVLSVTPLISYHFIKSHVSSMRRSEMCNRGLLRNLSRWVKLSEEVESALRQLKPVVALESTLITHGLPRPTNLHVASELEDIVRKEGSIPATIALLDGKIHIGLTISELRRISEDESAVKVSRRDLSMTLTRGLTGGTTVSSTCMAAHMAGIPIFATGGIGGVHRQFHRTLDISADLQELARTPVTVVSAGVKSILDIPKTLEYLETQGVPVVVHGSSTNFPGFFTRESGSLAPLNSDSIHEIAQFIALHNRLPSCTTGILLACPIPESHALQKSEIDAIIEKALQEASDQNITGARITPFLLQRIKDETHGKTLHANIALLKNNVSIASKLAVVYSNIIGDEDVHSQKITGLGASSVKTPKVVAIGASIVDSYAHTKQEIPADGCTHEGSIYSTCGGVARNHADALNRLNIPSLLISAVGDDLNGQFLRKGFPQTSPQTGWKVLESQNTACYTGIIQGGTVKFGIGDFEINQYLTPQMVKDHEKEISTSKLVLIDGNCCVKTIQTACDVARNAKVPIWYEPTDASKMRKIFDAKRWQNINYVSPNLGEFEALLDLAGFQQESVKRLKYSEGDKSVTNLEYIESMKTLTKQLSDTILAHLDLLLLSLGSDGVIGLFRHNSQVQVDFVESPSIPVEKLVSVSGAGDCFNAGVIFALLNDFQWPMHLQLGQELSEKCLISQDTVPKSLKLNE